MKEESVPEGYRISETVYEVKVEAGKSTPVNDGNPIVNVKEEKVLPTPTPNNPNPTPTPGTPGSTPDPTPDPTSPAAPTPTATVITRQEDNQVLGATRVQDGGAVLGARRGMDYAVLGKRRRPSTGDSMAMILWLIALGGSAAIAATSVIMMRGTSKKNQK